MFETSVICCSTQLLSVNYAVIRFEKAINKVHTVVSGSRCIFCFLLLPFAFVQHVL